jgi:hypothetical protein
LPWPCSGAASSAGTESRVEILERLLEADLIRIELAHGQRQPVLREVARLDAARLGDQFHGAGRRPVVAVGQHVDVRVRHSPAVQLPGSLR